MSPRSGGGGLGLAPGWGRVAISNFHSHPGQGQGGPWGLGVGDSLGNIIVKSGKSARPLNLRRHFDCQLTAIYCLVLESAADMCSHILSHFHHLCWRPL